MKFWWGFSKDNPLVFGTSQGYVIRFTLRYRFTWLTGTCQWQITIKCRFKFKWQTHTCQWQVGSCRWLNSYSWNTKTAHRAHSRIIKTKIQRKSSIDYSLRAEKEFSQITAAGIGGSGKALITRRRGGAGEQMANTQEERQQEDWQKVQKESQKESGLALPGGILERCKWVLFATDTSFVPHRELGQG